MSSPKGGADDVPWRPDGVSLLPIEPCGLGELPSRPSKGSGRSQGVEGGVLKSWRPESSKKLP